AFRVDGHQAARDVHDVVVRFLGIRERTRQRDGAIRMEDHGNMRQTAVGWRIDDGSHGIHTPSKTNEGPGESLLRPLRIFVAPLAGAAGVYKCKTFDTCASNSGVKRRGRIGQLKPAMLCVLRARSAWSRRATVIRGCPFHSLGVAMRFTSLSR